MPSFVFHSTTLERIPDEVDVAAFISDPERTSKGMANLCRVAGLSTQRIQTLAAADTSQRQTYEDFYSAFVSGGINEFWTQAKYYVHFRIEKEKLGVSISDDIYSPRIPPTERSDGFQWYLSFFSTILDEDSAIRNSVLLLDNPGVDLHADGQNNIKQFLEERLSLRTQVIYATHSPAMIDPYNLEQVRPVRLLSENEGTKVSNTLFKEGEEADLLEPVRSAIGASLVNSLMFDKFNVLVEGKADKPILEGAFSILDSGREKKVLINGSVSETKEGFLPRFYQRSRLPFVVLVDADSGGRNLLKLLQKWGIPDQSIVNLKDHFQDFSDDFELEDILSAEFYHRAVCETYPDKKIKQPEVDTRKRTKAYEAASKEQYNIGFNKRRVGETIKRLIKAGRGDEASLDNLKKVAEVLYTACEEQTSKSQPEAKS
jgi:predicted ATP-dependent endonuclease of OLD family